MINEAIEIDKENGDTLWWDAILQEMKKYDLRSKHTRVTKKTYLRIPTYQMPYDI